MPDKEGVKQLVPIPPTQETVNTLFGADVHSEAEMQAWYDKERVAPPSGEATNGAASTNPNPNLFPDPNPNPDPDPDPNPNPNPNPNSDPGPNANCNQARRPPSPVSASRCTRPASNSSPHLHPNPDS